MSDQLRKMQELLERQEPLHPDLEEHLGQMENGWPVLRHPLLYAVPYIELWNGMYNEQYQWKVNTLQKALQDHKWDSYVFIPERPYRFEALLRLETEYSDEISDETFWDIFGSCWTDTENMWQIEQIVRVLLRMALMRRPNSHNAIMDEAEHHLLKSLPDKFVVYRGHQRKNQKGLSWTLSLWKAHWFAQRFYEKQNARVSRAVCKKEDVIGLFLGRNELEIGVLPENLEEIKSAGKLRRPANLNRIVEIAVSEFKLEPHSFHGPAHWENVERNVLALAKETPEADLHVCRLFAILHDTQRQNEDEDELHGTRSARFIKKLNEQNPELLNLNEDQLKKLMQSCVNHAKGDTTDDPTIGVCWDADRIDLLRVGTIPDPKFFSTKAARELLWRI